MTNREKIEYIISRLGLNDLLLALAEEAAELNHAALKLHRVLYGKSPTPVTEKEAATHLSEEMGDTTLCWGVILTMSLDGANHPWVDVLTECQQQKLDRWVQRLKKEEKKQ